MDRRNSYRVITWMRGYDAYKCQVKRWWFPMWTTFITTDYLADAERYCRTHANPTIKDLGKLP